MKQQSSEKRTRPVAGSSLSPGSAGAFHRGAAGLSGSYRQGARAELFQSDTAFLPLLLHHQSLSSTFYSLYKLCGPIEHCNTSKAALLDKAHPFVDTAN